MVNVDSPPDEDTFSPYHRIRYHAAREAGLTRIEARRFALGQETLQTLRQLRRDGCSPSTLARIVT